MNTIPRTVLWALIGLILPLRMASAQDHQITPWRHNHAGAVTLSFDDGYLSQVTNAVPLLNARGLKATFFVCTTDMEVSWNQWRQVAEQGHEIGSHTVNHLYLTGVSDSVLRYELSESQRVINQNVPTQLCLTLAYPGTLNNSYVQAVTSEYYIAARGGWASEEGGDFNFYEDIEPIDPVPPGMSFGAFKAVNFYNVAGDNAPYSMPISNLDDKLDAAMAYHAWYCPYMHAIPDDSSYFATLLDHIVARNLWMATFGDVAQYMRERIASALIVLSSDTSAIQLGLTNSLDGLIYNEPLTIRSIVPSTWLKVNIVQGGSSTVADSAVEGADTVVYFDAVPNNGTIVLTQGQGTGPDFMLVATPALQAVEPGGSTSYAVTVSPVNGFSSEVALSVSGLPTGAAGSFSPNPTTGSSVLSVTTTAGSPVGTYTLTITGVSGDLTRITTVTLVLSAPVLPDFALTAEPLISTIGQGGSTSYGVTIAPSGGFAAEVMLSVSGLPSGANGSFTPNPATGSSTLSITTGPGTPVGTYPLTITGVGGGLTHTATATLRIVGPGVRYDSSVSTDIQFGVTTVTTPAFLVGDDNDRAAMIMVAMSANTATGITASLGGVSGTLIPGTDTGKTAAIRTLIFQVIDPPSGLQTATVSWTTGMNVSVGVITVTGADQTAPCTNGTFVAMNENPSSAASLTITSDFGDLTASIGFTADVWVSPFTNQTLVWGIDSGAVGGDISPGTGTSTHTWTDELGFQRHAVSGASFKASAVQIPDFMLSALPSSQTIASGNSTAYDVTINPMFGFGGQVTLSVSGLPSDANGIFAPNPATGSSTLSVTTSASTPAGTYVLTITGISDDLMHTTTTILTVTAPVAALNVTSPNGGESWATGWTKNITWTQTSLTGSVMIDLYKGGAWQKNLGTALAIEGSFSWTIASIETAGMDYRILVWQEGTVSDESDADFSLVRGVKVDFNKDGQEDVLWRCYGTEVMYGVPGQGWNVVWYLGETGALSPLALGSAQDRAGAMSALPGSTPHQAYLTPMEVGRSQTAGPERTLISPMDVGGSPMAGPAKTFASPMDVGKPKTARPIRTVVSPQDAGNRENTKQGRVTKSADDSSRRLSRLNTLQTTTEDITGDAILQDMGSPAAGDAKLMAINYGSDALLYTVTDLSWEIAGAGDFDGNGSTDILWRYYGAGQGQGTAIIWFMDGTTISSQGYPYRVSDTDWRIDRTGDFNGDGRADILWRHYGTGAGQGTTIIWYMNGATIIGQGYPYRVTDTDWKIDGIGDFDGDGRADLLWRYYGTGEAQGTTIIWHMDGTTILSQGYPYRVTDTDWKIDATGDFDADGKTDIVWRYYGAAAGQGTTIIWYLNGASIKGQDALYRVPYLDWRIMNR